MLDHEFELKKWALARLKADARVTSIVPADRIFAALGKEAAIPASPYVVFGNWVATGQDAQCIEGYLIQMAIDCYSHGPGEHATGALVEKVASAVRRALRVDEFDLTEAATGAISHRVTRYFDENGSTLKRAAIAMEAVVDEFED